MLTLERNGGYNNKLNTWNHGHIAWRWPMFEFFKICPATLFLFKVILWHQLQCYEEERDYERYWDGRYWGDPANLAKDRNRRWWRFWIGILGNQWTSSRLGDQTRFASLCGEPRFRWGTKWRISSNQAQHTRSGSNPWNLQSGKQLSNLSSCG